MAIKQIPIHQNVQPAATILSDMTNEQIAFSSTTDNSKNIAVGSMVHKVGSDKYVTPISTKINSDGVATPQDAVFKNVTVADAINAKHAVTKDQWDSTKSKGADGAVQVADGAGGFKDGKISITSDSFGTYMKAENGKALEIETFLANGQRSTRFRLSAVGNLAFEGLDAGFVQQDGSFSFVGLPLQHPDGIAQNHSATVGQVETAISEASTADRNRANHTGTQTASTISDFATAVAATPAVTANTAKVSNATHTGDVTGSTSLTITNDAVTNSKLANMGANTIKGAVSAGDPVDLTPTQVRTMLSINNVDNTSDANKPISTATQTALNLKANSADVYTKTEIDSQLQGLKPKQSVRVATTANITLSGTQTIDGVAVAVGNRVLVKNQTTGSQNGIYVVASSAWSRSTDADTSAEITSAFCFVEQGTSNADTAWVCITDNITIGTTSLVFALFAGSGAYAPISHVGSGGSSHAAVVSGGANGFMTGADKAKLDGVANGATANSTDAQLRDRSTHTGTQAISTVSGLQAALAVKLDATAQTIQAETNIANYTTAGCYTTPASGLTSLPAGWVSNVRYMVDVRVSADGAVSQVLYDWLNNRVAFRSGTAGGTLNTAPWIDTAGRSINNAFTVPQTIPNATDDTHAANLGVVKTQIANSFTHSFRMSRDGFPSGNYSGGECDLPYTNYLEDGTLIHTGQGVKVTVACRLTAVTLQFKAMAGNVTAYVRKNGVKTDLGTVTSAAKYATFSPVGYTCAVGDDVIFGWYSSTNGSYTYPTATGFIRQL